jgi:riboflavin kinase/FMN adenylyltransferase
VALPPTRAVVAVGVFDGVHRAHQQLIRTTLYLARRLQGTSVVITFDPDPQVVLDPAHAQPALMPLEARIAHLRAHGVDWVWVIPFTRRFARMRAEQFIRRILIRRLHAAALVVGETFVFGRNRHGDKDVLQTLGPPYGMQIVPVRQMRLEGAPISSSRIRRLIAGGQLALAQRLLGRDPELYGVVMRGTGRGRHLGFPTANIRLRSHVLPPRGVYAVVVRSLDHRRVWRGLMNLGVRPTFGPGPLVCEVHLLGFSGSLLGRSVSVSLLRRLRPERCFPSPQALARQVRRDIVRARQLFAQRS